MKILIVIIVGWLAITRFCLAENPTPSAAAQQAVFVEVENEMRQYAQYFQLVEHYYDSATATYVFACQSIDPSKAEWFVFVPIEIAYNVDAVCALFNQATADYSFWKEELASESARP